MAEVTSEIRLKKDIVTMPHSCFGHSLRKVSCRFVRKEGPGEEVCVARNLGLLTVANEELKFLVNSHMSKLS